MGNRILGLGISAMVAPLIWTMAVTLSSCASGPTTSQSRADRNVITAEEIQSVPITSAADLLRRLRPSWLRERGPTSIRGGEPSRPLVYVDEVRSGSLEALEWVSTQAIREIRFINGRDATTRWGLDHGGGVIMILTGR